ncbi:hypothetical protein SAMN05421831_101329 [Allopseudospirillum japonicum]|uniref:Penicillin-binding protein activator n=1 Tax=Allopseudospirillum japonicum TaxID=64971 RepID=A0A1H6QFH1_9GAMM|nr:penicillin-binding protein activator [Allopseudospirillum japonicum]SEI40646.1 hypothetical protein SAMN05421831_101329 [Allopseudospirillum japonicum]
MDCSASKPLSGSQPQGQFLPVFFVLVLLTSLLTGCASSPSSSRPSLPFTTSRISVDDLLRQAQTMPAPQAAALRLDVLERLVAAQEYTRALQVAPVISPSLLTRQGQWRLLQAHTQAALTLGQAQQALAWLERLGPNLLPSLTFGEQMQFHRQRAQAYQALSEHEGAARAYFQLARLQPEQEARLSYQALWQSLMRLDAIQLGAMSQQEPQGELKGWFELAYLRQQSGQEISYLFDEVLRWQTRYPEHPASSQLPKDVALLTRMAQNPVQQIAVFLPETGALATPAEALRNGLIAHQLFASQQGLPAPRLKFYNTEGADLDALYQRARAEGADFVVGPLAKAKVTQLQQKSTLPLPTLALNYGTNTTRNPDLIEFGLSAEDEAQQVAHKAWSQGLKRALVLIPQDPWGERVLASFEASWHKLGGQLVHVERYSANQPLVESVSRLLDIPQSEARKDKLVQLIRRKIEFTPRPRQDADWLFLLGLPSVARQVKPALAYYFAADLPVLATSHVYTGEPNPEQDRDLNGIQFCDLPWHLDSSDLLNQRIRAAWPQQMLHYSRLYAMGSDAYLLATRMPMLKALPNSRLLGGTGHLSLEQGRIRRELFWAYFADGLPMRGDRHAQPTDTSTADDEE